MKGARPAPGGLQPARCAHTFGSCVLGAPSSSCYTDHYTHSTVIQCFYFFPCVFFAFAGALESLLNTYGFLCILIDMAVWELGDASFYLEAAACAADLLE